MAAELRAEDDLTAGQFGTIYYKPATVAGIEVQLEPLQPSIGTAIHGLDLARAPRSRRSRTRPGPKRRTHRVPARLVAATARAGVSRPRASVAPADGAVRAPLRRSGSAVWRASAQAELAAYPWPHRFAAPGIPGHAHPAFRRSRAGCGFRLACGRHLAAASAHGVDADVPGSAADWRRYVLLRLLRHVGRAAA